MLLRERAREVMRSVREYELSHNVTKLVKTASARPLLVAAVFALGLLGLISIAGAWRSMGARVQG
jgi:hypothetical protein